MASLKDGKVRIAVLFAIVALAAAAGVVVGMTMLDPSFSCDGSGVSRTFTLVASSTGFNDSKNVVGLGTWPVLSVSRCDKVTVKIVNVDSQDHGVAVGTYSMQAIDVPAGQTVTLKFVAYQTGNFRIYCTTACSVHEFMVNGELKVS